MCLKTFLVTSKLKQSIDVIPETRMFIVSLISVSDSTRSNTKAPSSSPGLTSVPVNEYVRNHRSYE